MGRLESLLAEYSAAQPNAARGGFSALAGFDYQIRAYLADFVSSLVSESGSAGSANQLANAFEALSDYTRPARDRLVCVQAKLRITRSTAARAAVEFCRIDEFLHQYDPDFRNEVCYEAIGSAVDDGFQWSGVKLPLDSHAQHDGYETRWRELLANGRICPVRIDTDPWWRLLSSVLPRLQDPFAFARRALDRTLGCDRDPAAVAALRCAIAEDYHGSLTQNREGIACLSPSDATEIPYPSTEVVISSTPTLEHLRRGYFHGRRERVSEIVDLIDQLLVSRASQGVNNFIDVVWIQGQSGSGKSVLLLQVLQRMLAERDTSVVWLANAVHMLPVLVDQMASSTMACVPPEFLFVDDLYDPQARDDFALAKVVSRLVHSPDVRWPMIITCGPKEFRQALERDSRAEGLRLHTYSLNPMEPEETEAVVRWFEERSGLTVARGSAIAEQNALMISVLFEMKHGDLRPFAHRFSSRLQDQCLGDALRVPLALNRLYIWAPAQWLSESEQARLEVLNQDKDFAIVSPELRRGYLRLSHPHLSDVIYRTIYEDPSGRGMAADLAKAFGRALQSDFATANRIMHAIARANPRLAHVDGDELARRMVDELDANLERVLSSPKIDQAFFWTAWCRWRSRDFAVSLLTERHEFLAYALDALGESHPYWPSLWRDLWECNVGDLALARHATSWLRKNWGDPRWSLPWRELLAEDTGLVEGLEDAASRRDLMMLAWVAILNQPDLPEASWILDSMLRHRDLLSADEQARLGIDLVPTWLDQNRDSTGWPFVWRTALLASIEDNRQHDTQRLLAMALTWLEDRRGSQAWVFVFKDVVRNRRLAQPFLSFARVAELGRSWIAGWPGHPSTIVVQLALIRQAADKNLPADEVAMLIEWLSGHIGEASWHAIWRELFVRKKGLISRQNYVQLYSVGCRALAETSIVEDQIQLWPHLFTAHLMEEGLPSRSQLVGVGMELLADTSIPNWPATFSHFLRLMRKADDPDAAAVSKRVVYMARRWLTTAGKAKRADWSQVHRKLLLEGLVDDPAFIQLGISKLAEVGTVGDAYFATVLLQHVDNDRQADQIVEWLTKWFDVVSLETQGTSLWRRLDRLVADRLNQGAGEIWRQLRQVIDRNRPPAIDLWATLTRLHLANEDVPGRVVKTALLKGGYNRPNRVGFVVDIGTSAFMSLRDAIIPSDGRRTDLVGERIVVKIISMDEANGHIDVSQQASREGARRQFLAGLKPGAPLEGKVKTIVAYGLFVDVGMSDALLHRSQMEIAPSVDLEEGWTIGQRISTRVHKIDLRAGRLWLTLKQGETA